jgi:ABC-type sugar transport system ATPase subunit
VPTLALVNLGRTFATGPPALSAITLTIPAGTTAALIGPSGAGKSTLLRLVAGLEPPSAGQVYFDTTEVTNWPPDRRSLGWLPQRAVLLPHLDVAQNLNLSGQVRAADLMACADQLGIRHLLHRRPSELSGGERQRSALGRALVRRPQVWLLDEPFSALDPPLRAEVRQQVRTWQQATGATLLLTTHDPADVSTLADRVFVLDAGRLVQSGSRAEVQAQPATACAAWVCAAGAARSAPQCQH